MRTKEWAAKAVKEQADQIRESVKGGSLFGWPIDLENVEALIVAAYSLGQDAQRQLTASDWQP